ncbi:MAG: S8/S53 family peptidase [Oligoflexales bacterium]|nr:S8/S53 family peptidase [Oligoflexales bacterium]
MRFSLIFLFLLVNCASRVERTTSGWNPQENPQGIPQDADPEPAKLYNHVVMLIDSGIDPNHEAYKDKVLASYTLICASSPKIDVNKNYNELKKDFIINTKDGSDFGSSCELKEGIETRSVLPPVKVLALRERWNQSIKERNEKLLNFTDSSKVKDYLEEYMSSYHGTNSTAIIAYKNPNVKFVLVEKKIGARGEQPKKVECKEIEDEVPLMSILHDSEVKRTLIERCKNSETNILHDLALKYKVSLVNKSYGSSGSAIESFLRTSGCSQELKKPIMTSLSGIAQVEQGIRSKANMDYDQTPYITIQAAGNQGISLNSPLDSPDCSDSVQHLLVGSYNITDKKRSDFSNYGSCVDLYNLGSRVVTSNPQNFLTITDGTSFSAPLTIRYISFEFSEETLPKKIVEELKKRLDPNQFLPPSKHYKYAAYEARSGDLKLADDKFNPVFIVNNPLDEEILNNFTKWFARSAPGQPQ